MALRATPDPADEGGKAALRKICKEIRKSSTDQTNRLPREAASSCPWQKSSPFHSAGRACPEPCSVTVGGWNRRPPFPPLSPFRSAPLRIPHPTVNPTPSPKPVTSPSSIPGIKPMSIATTSDFETTPANPLATPLILAAFCVALADWLFYGWVIGISLALFFGVLGPVALF